MKKMSHKRHRGFGCWGDLPDAAQHLPAPAAAAHPCCCHSLPVTSHLPHADCLLTIPVYKLLLLSLLQLWVASTARKPAGTLRPGGAVGSRSRACPGGLCLAAFLALLLPAGRRLGKVCAVPAAGLSARPNLAALSSLWRAADAQPDVWSKALSSLRGLAEEGAMPATPTLFLSHLSISPLLEVRRFKSTVQRGTEALLDKRVATAWIMCWRPFCPRGLALNWHSVPPCPHPFCAAHPNLLPRKPPFSCSRSPRIGTKKKRRGRWEG